MAGGFCNVGGIWGEDEISADLSLAGTRSVQNRGVQLLQIFDWCFQVVPTVRLLLW